MIKEETINKYIGLKYDTYTVKEVDKNKIGRYPFYICECECGKQKTISMSTLRNNTFKRCECQNVDNNIGVTYGRWLIIEKDLEITAEKERPYYKCKCLCGKENIKSISLNSLRNGSSKSCGCIKLEKTEKLDLENINKKYGFLTVISRNFEDIRKGLYYWCKCDCGSPLKSISLGDLRGGSTLSCGCYAKEMSSKRLKGKKKYNRYDLTGEYGIGWDSKDRIFFFDLIDYDKIKDYTWYVNKKGYIVAYLTGESGKYVIMFHRLVMDCPDGMQVDHINGISTRNDNRKYNLRNCTHTENQWNKVYKKKGIILRPSGKWEVSLKVNGKLLYLGRYNTEEEALKIRIEAEKKYYGEFAPIRRE